MKDKTFAFEKKFLNVHYSFNCQNPHCTNELIIKQLFDSTKIVKCGRCKSENILV